FVDLMDVLGDPEGCAVLVVPGSAGATARLLELRLRYWSETEVYVKPIQVSDNDTPGREADSGREGRSRDDAGRPTLPKFLFHDRTLGVGEAGVVERGSVLDASGQPGPHRSRFILCCRETLGDFLEVIFVLFVYIVTDP